ncbi:MAG: serine/threonine protein kinase, partial [Magnetococcales bacterium]|nr:serine/threonine protein kinase [Magnetococcales bacterium]
MSSTQFTDALPAGSKILWFEIIKVLGKGGFGITYLGRDTNQDQLVAIKEYLPSTFASRTEDRQVQPNSPDCKEKFEWGLKRFLKEAQILARFRHSAIVRVVSFFRDSNTAYMVMEFVDGEGMDGLLKRKKTLTENEVRKLLPPLLDGLEVLHNANFIHRDLKPPNILIRQDGTPVILDFGSARQSAGDDMTSLLSLGYSPFEQYDSSGERQGPWSDIYAMGGVIYRCISGKKPTDAAMRIAARLRNDMDPMKPALEVGKGRFNPEFLKAVDKALEVLETDRPQSIREWRKLLGIEPATAASTTKKVLNRGAVSPAVDGEQHEVKRKKSSWRSFIASINEFSLPTCQPHSEEAKKIENELTHTFTLGPASGPKPTENKAGA